MSANSNGSMCKVQCVCILGPNMHATKHEICNIRTATSATYHIWFLGYNIQHTTYCNIPHVDHAGTRGRYLPLPRAQLLPIAPSCDQLNHLESILGTFM